MTSADSKHRAADETRRVPIPPELVAILRAHVATFGVAPDGRMFSSDRGHPLASTAISDVWAEARALALTPAQVASPLAGRPYDLRHAAVSLWLAAGVPRHGSPNERGTASKSCSASMPSASTMARTSPTRA
jgi:integrase